MTFLTSQWVFKTPVVLNFNGPVHPLSFCTLFFHPVDGRPPLVPPWRSHWSTLCLLNSFTVCSVLTITLIKTPCLRFRDQHCNAYTQTHTWTWISAFWRSTNEQSSLTAAVPQLVSYVTFKKAQNSDKYRRRRTMKVETILWQFLTHTHKLHFGPVI